MMKRILIIIGTYLLLGLFFSILFYAGTDNVWMAVLKGYGCTAFPFIYTVYREINKKKNKQEAG